MFSKDIGIDLGTANTLVYLKGKGIVMREPSVVTLNIKTGDIVAVGSKAKEMIGKTPGSIVVVRPLKDGVVADFDVTSSMINYFISKTVKHRFLSKPRVLICVPSGVTDVERRAVEEATRLAGAASVELIEEPMAAALGAGLPVMEASGSMIIDIGGGTSEVAVLSLGDVVTAYSVRVAGDKFDDAIITYVKRNYNLLIGEKTAERVKIEMGSVLPYEGEGQMEIRGRDLLNGLPKDVTISSEEVREALKVPISSIVEAVRSTLEDTPPELSADIMKRGIVLTGGGALLRGLDKLLESEVKMPVTIAENPLDCVAEGTGKYLEMFSMSKRRRK